MIRKMHKNGTKAPKMDGYQKNLGTEHNVKLEKGNG